MTDPQTEIVSDFVSAREFLMSAAKRLAEYEGEGMKLHRTRMAVVEVDQNISDLAFPSEADVVELVS